MTAETQTRERTDGAHAPRRQQRSSARLRAKALKTALAALLLVIAASLGYGLLAEGGRKESEDAVPTAEVTRGDLLVTVTARGDIYSMNPLEIKNAVEGYTTILEIAPEGTLLTEKDVEEGKVIIRLDSSTLEQTVADRQISLFGAEASFVQAKESHDIQVKQNESNVAAAELKLRFARMDAERYLGASLTSLIIEQGLESVDLGALARSEADRLLRVESDEAAPVPEGLPGGSAAQTLGGEALQQLRRLTSAVQLATAELARAEEELQWSEALSEKKYISANELVGDKIEAQRRALRLSAGKEDLELFLRYTLQKEAQQLLSDCTETQRDLERVQARARSQLAQARASLRSREASYKLEKERLDKSQTMLANCTIVAPRPGRIAYGSSAGGSWGRRGRSQSIEQGAGVSESQVIARIPDLSALAVRVNISEKDIDKVKVGQPALITIEATPDSKIPGEVARISPMASATQAWLAPDTKVYEAEVALKAIPDMFIPGMSANVVIVVAELKDVMSAPAQAVMREQGFPICWVRGAERPVPRMVETGMSSPTRVEIKSGLRAGERVYLAPPDEGSREQLASLIENAKKRQSEELPGEIGPEGMPPGFAEDVRPAQPPGEQPAAAQVDWRAEMEKLRGLSEEEREQKMQELLQRMPAEQREQMEARRRRNQNMSPEDRERVRPQRGGRGPGAPGPAGPPPQ